MTPAGGYTPAPDAAAAAWVVQGLRGFAASVLSVVPAGFPAYARVFHPARRRDGDRRTVVGWREVAAANGRVAHRAMQWPSLVGSRRRVHGDTQPGVWDEEPAEGSLPRDLALVLAGVLTGHTTTADRCWFAVWDGFGCLPAVVQRSPSFWIPHRRLLLLTGAIGAVAGSLCPPPFWQSPSLWWPDDRAWCVATEIDLMSTYLGGSQAGVQAILDHPELEALAVEPTDPIAWDGDRRNPLPTPGPPGVGRRRGER